MKLDAELRILGSSRAVLTTHVDEVRDVAVVVLSPSESADPEVYPWGLSYREPTWADSVQVMGYPPVPLANDAYLTVQSGEVVNPSVDDLHGGHWFLFSATARPGNSGGPIVGADGRLLGLVTREFSNGPGSSVAPFYVGAPTSEIFSALEGFGMSQLLPVEDWET